MELTTTNIPINAQAGFSSAARDVSKVDVKPIKNSQPAPKQAEPSTLDPEVARRDFIEQAAKQYRASLSDNRVSFTIYKDAASGKFITRFTNLADGTVTHIPEPELVQYLTKLNGGVSATIRTDA